MGVLLSWVRLLTPHLHDRMTDEAISPLRWRMIEDMTMRKLPLTTYPGYIRTVKDFAAFLGRSPDTASGEDVRRFQLHLRIFLIRSSATPRSQLLWQGDDPAAS